MTTALASLLLIVLGLAILCIPAERQRVARGFKALHHVFGLQFVIAMTLVGGLLLWAVHRQHGGVTIALGLVLALIVLRAHDLGEEDGPQTEYDAFWQGTQWSAADVERALARAERKAPLNTLRALEEHQQATRQAVNADPSWLRERHEVAFGPLHEPVEL